MLLLGEVLSLDLDLLLLDTIEHSVVQVHSLALRVIPLLNALGAHAPHNLAQLLDDSVIVLEQIALGNTDLHALLHEVDSQLPEGCQVLAHPSQDLLLVELPSEEHSHSVLRNLIRHLQLAQPVRQSLHQHLAGDQNGSFEGDEEGKEVVGSQGAASLDDGPIEFGQSVEGEGEELLPEVIEDPQQALALILDGHALGLHGQLLLHIVQQIIGRTRTQLGSSVLEPPGGLPDGVDSCLGSSINVVERIEGVGELLLGKGEGLGVVGEVVGELLVDLGDDLHYDVRNDLQYQSTTQLFV